MKGSAQIEERLRHIHEVASKTSVAVTQDGSLIQSPQKNKLLELQDLNSVEEIESTFEELSRHMNKMIKNLHTQDEIELESLEENSVVRGKLKRRLEERIKEQQEELSFASQDSKAFEKI